MFISKELKNKAIENKLIEVPEVVLSPDFITTAQ
jgi:hypothetical protein